MNSFTRRFSILLAAFLLSGSLSDNVANSQDVADPDHLAVDVMPMLELPAQLANPILLKSERGYLLECQISNNSEDLIRGFTYQLLVLDSAGKFRMMITRTATLKLAGYTTKDLTLQLSEKLKIKNGDRAVLAVEQFIGRELVWEVLNSRAALEAYGRGDYEAPEVKQVLNQIDSMPSPRAIYRK